MYPISESRARECNSLFKGCLCDPQNQLITVPKCMVALTGQLPPSSVLRHPAYCSATVLIGGASCNKFLTVTDFAKRMPRRDGQEISYGSHYGRLTVVHIKWLTLNLCLPQSPWPINRPIIRCFCCSCLLCCKWLEGIAEDLPVHTPCPYIHPT